MYGCELLLLISSFLAGLISFGVLLIKRPDKFGWVIALAGVALSVVPFPWFLLVYCLEAGGMRH